MGNKLLKRLVFTAAVFMLLAGLLLIGFGFWQIWSQRQEGRLHSVCSLPGKGEPWVVVGVGEKGLILRSDDSGWNWIQKTNHDQSKYKLNSVHFTDARHGWAVGENGIILATADGGETWNVQNNPDHRTLYSVYFADPHNGWAVGDNGIILATVDGGGVWNPQVEPSRKKPVLRNVYFIANDASHGWAVGDNGTILSTTDRGGTWVAQLNPDSENNKLSSVHFANFHDGWAVGDNDVILSTDNGGRTWVLNDKPDSKMRNFASVHFIDDAHHGWAAGVQGILSTEDGGKTWISQPINALEISSIHFADDLHGWAVGDKGILTTSDGGKNWRSQTEQPQGQVRLFDENFINDLQGWTVGEKGIILATTDGGENWTNQNNPDTQHNDLHGVCFADPRHGWAVGDNGIIISTADGGIHWKIKQNPDPSQSHLYGLHFADSNHGWVVGQYGIILDTADGGNVWTIQDNPDPQKNFLANVHFADANYGWAVGEQGVILATTDGGNTWHTRTNADQGKPGLEGIYFTDTRHGWAVGEKGTILATSDGGETWIQQGNTDRQMPRLHSVHFINDARHGWAVGDNGTILFTKDSGKLWETQPNPDQNHLNKVHFADAAHGWAVGNNRTILHTADGGRTWSDQHRSSNLGVRWLFGIGLAVCVGAVWILWKTRHQQAERHPTGPESSDEYLESDNPLQSADDDSLAFGDIVEGMSRFLRNINTESRLTIAVTGEWGSGKSSLMNLLKERLLEQGYRPVWFNAWHHQKEEHFLDSLDCTIREQAAPPFFVLGISRTLFWWLIGIKSRPIFSHLYLLFNLMAILALVVMLALAFELIRTDWGSPVGEPSVFELWFSPPLELTEASFIQLCRDQRLTREWVNRLHAGLASQAQNPNDTQPTSDSTNKAENPELLGYCQILEQSENGRTDLQAVPPCWISSSGKNPCSFRDKDDLLQKAAKALRLDTAKPLTEEQSQALKDYAEHTALKSAFPNMTKLKETIWAIGHLFGILFATGWILKLLYGFAKVFSLRRGQEPVGYRQRFESDFKHYASAMKDRLLVLLIDDLDRCNQEQVSQILESVNFLVSSGDCFIIIGLAPKHVLNCVGLQFKDLAYETSNSLSAEVDGRHLRTKYARAYLEKLVNIEVPVPKPQEEHRQKLVMKARAKRKTRHNPEKETKTQKKYKTRGFLLQSVLPIVLLLAVFFGYCWFNKIDILSPPEIPIPYAQPPSESLDSKPENPTAAAGVALAPEKKLDSPKHTPQIKIVLLDKTFQLAKLWWVIIVLTILLVIWFRLKEPKTEIIADTPEIRKALLVWREVIAAHRNTPRTLKRFINRMRFFAMYGRVGYHEANDLSDAHLVALGALHYLNPEWLGRGGRHQLALREIPAEPASIPTRWHELHLADGSPIPPEILSALTRAIHEHNKQFPSWPPKQESIKLFKKMAEGLEIL